MYDRLVVVVLTHQRKNVVGNITTLELPFEANKISTVLWITKYVPGNRVSKSVSEIDKLGSVWLVWPRRPCSKQ